MRVWKQWTDEKRATRKTASNSALVYCYRCTNVGLVNSSTSAAQWVSCKGPPPCKPSTAASAMSSEPGKLIGTQLSLR
ncbi:hypothetical protein TNCV_461451 [Trichonephila clavipes]|nr:hypothetical protein TNCV_461451 [Trichonephila clavipes]